MTGSLDRLVPGRNATTLSRTIVPVSTARPAAASTARSRAWSWSSSGSVDILLQKSAAFELVLDDRQW